MSIYNPWRHLIPVVLVWKENKDNISIYFRFANEKTARIIGTDLKGQMQINTWKQTNSYGEQEKSELTTIFRSLIFGNMQLGSQYKKQF
jgi:hypothetical protein